MGHLVVVGGGWSGCAAALAAAKQGLAVTVLEKTDRLLGSGLVGGIMRNNGRFTAAEELKLMGAGELLHITDRCSRHHNLDFPGHRHASLYDVDRVEGEVVELLRRYAVRLCLQSRAVEAEVRGKYVRAVHTAGGERVEGDVFIDAAGTAGPIGSCSRFGNGCAMCIYRCPTFGARVSIAVRSGLVETSVIRSRETPGYFSGSCELEPASVGESLLKKIRTDGVALVPLFPEGETGEGVSSLELKACRQYARPEYAANLVLLDTGAVKMMAPYFPLGRLRRLPGLERAVYRDPLGGSTGNSIRFTTLLRCTGALLAPPLANLFLAGERAGLMVGHTEAMVTGTLAGYNAALVDRNEEPLVLPRTTACGELIAFACQKGRTREGRRQIYTLSGGPLWDNLQRRLLYTVDPDRLRRRLAAEKLLDLFRGII